MNAAPVGVIDEALAASLVPQRDARGHKGTFGRVSVVAGSLDYAGAALMSGAAALRAGAGLVTLFVPASVQPHILGRVPELITRGLPESGRGAVDAPAAAAMVVEHAAEALLVGPGLQPGRGTTRLLKGLLAAEGPSTIIDAGALDALSGIPGWSERVVRRCVLTPHPGELRRLGRVAGSTDEERATAAVDAATAWGQVVVLKGAGSIVAHPDGRAVRASFSVPALGSAGTGDVLAGIVAGLVGQGLTPFDAAVLGVYLHARAGEHVSDRLGDAGLMATDLLPEIPRVRRHLRDGAQGGRLGFETRSGDTR